MIAGTLKGAVSQRLVPTADGRGRVACCEILRMTGRVRDMIMDPTQTGRLPEVIAEGAFYGMQTFDQHLFEHLKAGRVTMEQALQAASSPHDFKLLVAADGKRGTTMDDLFDAEPAAPRSPCSIARVASTGTSASSTSLPHHPVILHSARGEARSVALDLPAGELAAGPPGPRARPPRRRRGRGRRLPRRRRDRSPAGPRACFAGVRPGRAPRGAARADAARLLLVARAVARRRPPGRARRLITACSTLAAAVWRVRGQCYFSW